MTDEWHQLSNEQQRQHEEELKSDWESWVGKERPWQTYWNEYYRWKKDGPR